MGGSGVSHNLDLFLYNVRRVILAFWWVFVLQWLTACRWP